MSADRGVGTILVRPLGHKDTYAITLFSFLKYTCASSMTLDSRYFYCLLPHSQVGVGVNGDLTRLRNAYSVEGAGAVDLAVASRRYGIRNSGSFSLSALTASFLQRALTKEEAVRRSAWQSTLSKTQGGTLDSRSTVIFHRYFIQRAYR